MVKVYLVYGDADDESVRSLGLRALHLDEARPFINEDLDDSLVVHHRQREKLRSFAERLTQIRISWEFVNFQ